MKTGWGLRRIADVCDLATGGTPPRSRPEFFGGEIKWLVSGDIHRGEILDCDGRITEAGMRHSNAKLLPIDSVLIALNGQGKTRGTVALLKTPAACNQSLVCITPKQSSGLLPEFLYANLHGRYEEIRRLTSDDDKDRRGLNMGIVGGISVPIPPIADQRRIVSLLGEALRGIATAKANAEKNLENARSVFESELALTFGADWEGQVATTLGNAYDVRDGTHDSPKYQDVGYPLVTSKNLRADGLSLEDVDLISESDFQKIRVRSRVDRGDVLLAMIGTIGNPTLVEIEPAFAIKNVALFKVPQHHSAAFLRYYLSSPVVKSRMAGESKGTTQRFVGLGYLRAFPIKLPPLEAQRQTVTRLDVMASDTGRLEAVYQCKIVALDELKKSLMHQAFAGEQ